MPRDYFFHHFKPYHKTTPFYYIPLVGVFSFPVITCESGGRWTTARGCSLRQEETSGSSPQGAARFPQQRPPRRSGLPFVSGSRLCRREKWYLTVASVCIFLNSAEAEHLPNFMLAAGFPLLHSCPMDPPRAEGDSAVKCPRHITSRVCGVSMNYHRRCHPC